MQKEKKNIAMILFPQNRKMIMKKTIARSLVWFNLILAVYLVPTVYLNIVYSAGKDDVILTMIGFIFFLLLVFILNYLYQRLYFKFFYFEISGRHIIIKRGPFELKETIIPFEKIIDVGMYQGFLDKPYKLYNISMMVDFGKKEKIGISGFDKEVAQRLLDFIVKSINFRIKEVEGENLEKTYQKYFTVEEKEKINS